MKASKRGSRPAVRSGSNARLRNPSSQDAPKKIALLAIEHQYLSSSAVIADVIHIANSISLSKQFKLRPFSHAIGRDPGRAPFKVEVLSIDGKAVTSADGAPVTVDRGIDAADEAYSLVFIPGFNFRRRSWLAKDLTKLRSLYPWLIGQYNRGALIAANSAGVFVLAETGLLDNRMATIGWWMEDEFRHRYPAVKLDVSRQVTESGNLFCANTIGTNFHLACRLLELLGEPTVSEVTGKAVFAFGQNIVTDSFLSVSGSPPASDALIAKAQTWLAQNCAAKVKLSDLAAYTALGERTLIRRFKELLGTTPHAYLRSLRINNAQYMLTSSRMPIDQIAARVGYSNIDFFKKSFKAHTGVSPAEYRRKGAGEGTVGHARQRNDRNGE